MTVFTIDTRARLALGGGILASALLGACAAPSGGPLAGRGADGLPDGDALWVTGSPALAERRDELVGRTGSGTDGDAAGSAASPAKAPDARYTVRAGDSLAAIARRTTGNAENWRELARVNGIDDPAALEVGTELVVPSSPGDGSTLAGTVAARPEGPTVDLIDVLALAQEHDATFRIARERHDVARAAIPIARAPLLPQASAQAQIGRFTTFDDGGSETGAVVGDGEGAGAAAVVPGGSGDDYTESQIGASIEQALFDRPSSIALDVARLDADVAEVQLLAEHESLVLRVARAYFDVLRAASVLEFRTSDLDAIGRQLQQADRRFEVGGIAITDVVEARARRDLARAAEIDARNALADAREALTEISGIPADAVALERLDEAFVPIPPDPADAEAWVKMAEAGNTQLLAALGAAESAERQVAQVRAGRLPRFAIGANVASLDSDNALRPDGESGNVSLTATLPILSGGRVTAQVAARQAQARLAAEQASDARRQVVRGARNAYRGVLAGISRAQALEQALASTDRAARATEAGFEAGTRTAVEVLESQRDTFSARADYAAARHDYIVSLLELRRAAGTLDRDVVRRVDGWLGES